MENEKKNGLLLNIQFILIGMLAACLLAFVIYFLSDYFLQDKNKNHIAEEIEEAEELYSANQDDVLDMVSGNVPILEYHIINTPRVNTNLFLSGKMKLTRQTERFVVSSRELRKQLETLYQNGFRNISLNEYLSLMKGKRKNLKRIPAGSRLYCITFDDATYGQFDFLSINTNGIPVIDPECAVGILMDLSKKYRDFPLNAAFSVDFENTPFHQEKYTGIKLNILLDLGFEIVNHTRSHKRLSAYLPRRKDLAAFEIGRAMELFEKYLGERAVLIDKIAYPDGRSNPDVWKFIQSFTYNGFEYRFIAGLDAKGMRAKNPNTQEFNPYNISRIETSRFSFETFVLNAPDIYRIPAPAEMVSNGLSRILKDAQNDGIRSQIIKMN